jgi:hypothetical protein
MPVTAWTVNATRWIPRATRQGVFAVITNDPSKMLARRDLGRSAKHTEIRESGALFSMIG